MDSHTFNERQIKLIQDQTSCRREAAVLALEVRAGDAGFAIEYLQNRDIPLAMSEAERFPKWHQYLLQKRRV